MKSKAFFIRVVGLVVLSADITFANDAVNPHAQLSPAMTARQVPIAKESQDHATGNAKTGQPHNALPSSPAPKSSLPVNAGQKHGLTTVGGATAATAHLSAAINGTEIKRRP